MNDNATIPKRTEGSRSAWGIGIAAAIGVVLVAAAAMALAGTREDVEYEPGSPEAAMAAYVDAWDAGDVEAAYTALTTRAQARVPLHEFREVMTWDEEVPTRIWIEQRTDYDDRVVFDLTVETTYDGLFGPDRDTHSLRVTLINVDDAWRIDTPLVGTYSW